MRRLEHGLLINIHWEKWDHIISARPRGTLAANELWQHMLVIMGFLILQTKTEGCAAGVMVLIVRLPWGGQRSFSYQHLISVSSLWTVFGPGASVPPGGPVPASPLLGLSEPIRQCPAPAPGLTFLFLGIFPTIPLVHTFPPQGPAQALWKIT